MASMTRRTRKSGAAYWQVESTVRKGGKPLARSKSFDRESEARTSKREIEAHEARGVGDVDRLTFREFADRVLPVWAKTKKTAVDHARRLWSVTGHPGAGDR